MFTKYRDKKYNGWMKGGDREILTKRFSDILDIVESREKEIDEAAAAMEEDPAMPNTTVKVSEHNVAGHSTHHVRGVW